MKKKTNNITCKINSTIKIKKIEIWNMINDEWRKINIKNYVYKLLYKLLHVYHI